MGMKGIFILICLSLVTYLQVNGQKYGTTLGIRLANDDQRMLGLTMEQRVFDHFTLEGILQSDFSRNSSLHVLSKRHIPILTKRLNIFTGAGISFGNEESVGKDPLSREVVTTYGNSTFGVDLMIGAELTILGANVSLDYKPNINIAGRDNWFKDQVAISVRTVLIKDSKRNKRIRKKERSKKRSERKERFQENFKSKL